MKLRTPVKPIKSLNKLSHREPLLLTGSCFAENIGKQLKNHKFPVSINPLGIAYNPLSVHQLLNAKKSDFKSVKKKNGVFFHDRLHSEFNRLSEEAFHKKVSLRINEQNELISEVNSIIISYGTAIVNELKTSQEVVNNCHKQDVEKFEKRFLTVEEITNSFRYCQEKIQAKSRKEIQFIFTISPVRHLKEGYRQNQLSKAILHIAVEEIVNKYNNCYYFPSYEIMMDDLRDYRFYKSDLLHPNRVAVNYIWEAFEIAFCDEECRNINKQIKAFRQALNHRAFLPESKAHQNFLKNLKQEIMQFQTEKELDFSKELKKIEDQID